MTKNIHTGVELGTLGMLIDNAKKDRMAYITEASSYYPNPESVRVLREKNNAAIDALKIYFIGLDLAQLKF